MNQCDVTKNMQTFKYKTSIILEIIEGLFTMICNLGLSLISSWRSSWFVMNLTGSFIRVDKMVDLKPHVIIVTASIQPKTGPHSFQLTKNLPQYANILE